MGGLEQIANEVIGFQDRHLNSSAGLRCQTTTAGDVSRTPQNVKHKTMNIMKRVDADHFSSLCTAASIKKLTEDEERESTRRLELQIKRKLKEERKRSLEKGKHTELGMRNRREHEQFAGFLTHPYSNVIRP